MLRDSDRPRRLADSQCRLCGVEVFHEAQLEDLAFGPGHAGEGCAHVDGPFETRGWSGLGLELLACLTHARTARLPAQLVGDPASRDGVEPGFERNSRPAESANAWEERDEGLSGDVLREDRIPKPTRGEPVYLIVEPIEDHGEGLFVSRLSARYKIARAYLSHRWITLGRYGVSGDQG